MELQNDTGGDAVFLPGSNKPVEFTKEQFRRFFADIDTTRTPIVQLEEKYGVARNTLHKYLRNREAIELQLNSDKDRERQSA